MSFHDSVSRIFVGGVTLVAQSRRGFGRPRITLPEPEAGADPGGNKGGVPSAGLG